MNHKTHHAGNILIIIPIILITLVAVVVGVKILNTKNIVKAVTISDVDVALTQYCEDPTKLESVIALAKTQGLTAMVTAAEKKRDEITCGVGKKPAQTKITPKPTVKQAQSDNAYNNYYYCASDETDRCELCWIDDYKNETCCYKSTEQVANGNDHCGPNDTIFPPSHKTRPDLNN
jgi:hypothetical protein